MSNSLRRVFRYCGRANRAALWMDEEREAKKTRTKSRPSTPADKASEARQYKSASGWRLEDLQNCSVEVEQNVDSLKMIPPKFFNFEHEHLKQYTDSSSTPFNICLTTLVRNNICTLSSDDAINNKEVCRSAVACKQLFLALSRMVKLQPAIREYRLAQKRSEKNISRSQNTVSGPTSAGTLRCFRIAHTSRKSFQTRGSTTNRFICDGG